MAEYLHPGVYVEETSFRSPPLEGVSTSTAGLVGRTRKGREGHPTLVTSYTEFVRRFGRPFDVTGSSAIGLGDYLGHAVRAFFDNGGKRAYIVRALSKSATAASSQLLLGQVYLQPATTTVRGPTTTIPLTTTRGIQRGTTLQIWSRPATGVPVPVQTVTVDDVDVTRNTITIATPGIVTGRTLLPGATFYTDVANAPGGAGPTFAALSRGAGGNSIGVQIRPSEGPAVRLNAQRFFRSRATIQAFSGGAGDVGPGPGTAMTLNAAALARLLPGDTIEVAPPAEPTTPPITVASITSTATAGVLGGSITAGTVNTAGATVQIVQRGTAPPLAPITVYTFVTGDAVTIAAAATSVTLPQAAAVALRDGDVVEISDGATTIGFTLDADPAFTAAANDVTLAGAGLTLAHPAATVAIAASQPLSNVAQRIFVADTTNLAAPYANPPQQVAITNGTTTVATTVVLVDPATNTVYLDPATAIPADWASLELLQVSGSPAGVITVATTASFYTGGAVEVWNGDPAIGAKHAAVVTAVDPSARTLTLAPPPPAIVVDQDPALRRAFVKTMELDVLVYEDGVLKETFANLAWNQDPASDAFQRYFVDRINDPDTGSQLVNATFAAGAPPPAPTNQPITPDGFSLLLGGLVTGTDGPALTAVDLMGDDLGPSKRTGIEALKERTDIALVAVPGVTEEAVQAALLTHCENLKYRFAILDGRPGQSDISAIQAHRGNHDSKYGAYYAPWLKTIDIDTGKTMLAPPAGYVLGICARVDTERGVHKAPANETVRNILDVELPFSDGEQDVLNPVGVNLIRELEGRGIRVWGARTISSDPQWKYANVRRLFIFLEHSIDNGTQWVVFEPNNEALWERVKETIESFLFGVWKTGALMGTKPEEAYFVRCDRTTMTQDDIDNGRLVCLIGVAPSYPAEFVIFRVGQFTASTNRA